MPRSSCRRFLLAAGAILLTWAWQSDFVRGQSAIDLQESNSGGQVLLEYHRDEATTSDITQPAAELPSAATAIFAEPETSTSPEPNSLRAPAWSTPTADTAISSTAPSDSYRDPFVSAAVAQSDSPAEPTPISKQAKQPPAPADGATGLPETATGTSTAAASESPATKPSLHLAPRSMSELPSTRMDHPRRPAALLDLAKSKLGSLTTAGGGLAVVVGLFLAFAWFVKGGAANPTGALPADAFAVLGRSPLSSQSTAHLVRLGNKLVLVAVAGDGAQPLAEVTDIDEVNRIAALCGGKGARGSSAEFQQVLAQLAREPARGFLGREGAGGRKRT